MTTSSAPWHRAAAAASLPPGQCCTVQVAGRELALVNLDGAFFAIDNECPHKGAPLGAGLVENGCLYCPLHGWAFEVETGACRSNPEKPVATYPVKMEAGEVWVAFPGKC
jgi:nitrite reductase/ring-hydroxylating ferredoxin subunit